jgi:hypothetical protein
MTDVSFAIPRATYGKQSSSLAATGGSLSSKGSVASASENMSIASKVNSFSNQVSAMRSEPFKYSLVVRSRFYWAVILSLLGSSLSAFSLVHGSQKLGVFSAFVLAASGLCALGWLERADHERSSLH